MGLWVDPDRRTPFGSARGDAGRLEAVETVKDWTRDRFALAASDPVVVSERASTLPGFPPRETHVGFWTDGGKRHHFKVFKPVEAVTPEDIPPCWMRAALAESDFDCPCC